MNAPAKLHPDTVPFADAFVAVFNAVVEAGYSTLGRIENEPENCADGDYDDDPDDIRGEFARAIEETCNYLNLVEPRDDTAAEWTGGLMDIVTERWRGLGEYFTLTTEQ